MPLLLTLVAPLTFVSACSTFCAYGVGSRPVTSVTSKSTGCALPPDVDVAGTTTACTPCGSAVRAISRNWRTQ